MKAQLIYGSSLHSMENLLLRVRKIYFENRTIIVRDGKDVISRHCIRRVSNLPQGMDTSQEIEAGRGDYVTGSVGMGLVPHRDQVVSGLAYFFAIADGPTEGIAGIQPTLQVGIGAVLHVEGALQVNARSVGTQALDLDRPPEAVEEDDHVVQFFDHQLDAAFVHAGAVGQVTGQLDFLDGITQFDAGTRSSNCGKTICYIYLL